MTIQTAPAELQNEPRKAGASRRPARHAVQSRAVLKAKTIELPTDASVDDAIAAIIVNTRDHWNANYNAALQGRDIEGIHQIRVSLRRFRSALSLFKAYIPDTQRDWLNGEARWLLSELGPIRDLDAFSSELLPAFSNQSVDTKRNTALNQALKAARRHAHAKARTALEAPRTQRFLRRQDTWASARGWRNTAQDDVKDATSALARDFAKRALNKQMVKILAHGKRIDMLPIAELHKIRIAVKKTRYGVEFFRSVLPNRRTGKLAASLKELQDSLGHLNDLEMAEQIVGQMTSAAKSTEAASEITATGSAVVAYHRQAAENAVHGIAPRWRNVRKIGLI